jgi:MFS family permease
MGTFIWPMMTLILSAKFGYDAPRIALIMLIGGALQMPAQALGGKWADKYGRKNVLLISSYLMVSGYFLNAILPLGIHTIAIFFISGFFGSVTHPASHALIADKTSSVDRERAYSLSYLGFNLGFILGPSIGGFLFQNHLGLAFFIDGFTTLIGTVLIHIYIQDGLREGEHIEIGEYEKRGTSSIDISIIHEQ